MYKIAACLMLVLAGICDPSHLNAAAYVSDPKAGGAGGSGSKDSPWPRLEDCISNGKLSRLKPGDTLFLREGYHGFASISGINSDFINIVGVPGEEVQLSRLQMRSVGKWRIQGLRISPTFGEPYKGTIVHFADRDTNCQQVIIEDCEIFGRDDHKGMSSDDWMKINSGVLMGRHGKGHIVRNCYIRNTRFALSMSCYDGLAEGNIIEHFSADGIRMTRDGQTAQFNIIKKAFVTDGQGDKNHDDAIQCFLHNKGTGTMRNLTINHNIIEGHQAGVEPFSANNQGIGLFDGPLVNFHIEGNVVMVSHWHGVSVYDGQGCTVTRNITWSKFGGRLKPWVMLGTKLKKARDNTVTDNYAMSFNLKQPGTVKSGNKTVSKEIYERGLKELSKKHFEKYGIYHRVAKRHRVTGSYKEELSQSDYLPTGAKPDGSSDEVAGKKVNVRPAPEKKVTIDDSDLAYFNGELRKRLDHYLKTQTRRPRFEYSVFKKEVEIRARSGEAYKVTIPRMGSEMTLHLFKNIRLSDSLQISKAIAEDEDELDNALLAFFYAANGDQVNASFHMRKAGAHEERVAQCFNTE